VQRNAMSEVLPYSRRGAMPQRGSQVVLSEDRGKYATIPGAW
jgi:hypothetical protein